MLKKISGDAGHNCIPDSGALGYKIEDDLTKEVWDIIKRKLNTLNISVIDCTPYDARFTSVNESLSYRVNKANASSSELHLCIHFNAGGGNGTECWIYGVGGDAEIYAEKIANEISELGYVNRGVKVGNLYVPKHTQMPCVLVECSFVDSKEDMSRYNAENLALAIVKAITGKVVTADPKPTPEPNVPVDDVIVPNAIVQNDWLYIRDETGRKISGSIAIGSKVEVLDVFYSSQLVLLKYSSSIGVRTVYTSNALNCIKYLYADQWQNGSTTEIVYEDPECTKRVGIVNPYEKATPLYRKNGMLHIVYDTDKGKNTKSGFVKYNGKFTKF